MYLLDSKNIIIFLVVLGVIAGAVFFYKTQPVAENKPANQEVGGNIEPIPVPEPKKTLSPKSPPAVSKNPPVTPSAPFAEIIYPKGGERFCMGSTAVIRWKSLGIKTFGVYLRDTRDTTLRSDYNLGLYRADPSGTGTDGEGSFEWKIGYTMGGVTPPVAAAYKILIKGAAVGEKVITDLSDGLFSIARCN